MGVCSTSCMSLEAHHLFKECLFTAGNGRSRAAGSLAIFAVPPKILALETSGSSLSLCKHVVF